MVSWRLLKRTSRLLPDQHLGRNTAYDLGIPLDKMAVWDTHRFIRVRWGYRRNSSDFMERTLFCSSKFYNEEY